MAASLPFKLAYYNAAKALSPPRWLKCLSAFLLYLDRDETCRKQMIEGGHAAVRGCRDCWMECHGWMCSNVDDSDFPDLLYVYRQGFWSVPTSKITKKTGEAIGRTYFGLIFVT
jgi:hypothetical protein